MDISLHWLNEYLRPGDVTADEADAALTAAGFPIESRTELPGGDVLLDVEVTSNRGDVLSHLGCAREVAASPGAKKRRELRPPRWTDPSPGGPIGRDLALENREPSGCPLFTARLIRGVRTGPSPDWLVRRLNALGQRSINNVVDVTNFVTFEMGNPCHVFDYAKLADRRLVVRYAEEGEVLTTLDERRHRLTARDLVVADGEKAQSLAGVIGGFHSQVESGTTDVVFEMATWDPVLVRRTARRTQIRTDAAYRFERGVDARTIDEAARRAVALICELTGGTLAEGVLAEGAPLPEPTVVTLRPSRCRRLMGIEVPVGEMIGLLRSLEIEVEQTGEDELRCTIPAYRADLTREADLVEEVARAKGFDSIPINDSLAVTVRRPQERERAIREVASVLTGLGFFETVTISFVSPSAADRFLHSGLRVVGVDDERRKAEPALRPSVIPSLLACRRANRDAGVEVPGGVRLYEVSSVFAEAAGAERETREHRTLTLLADVPGQGAKRSAEDRQTGVRAVRGAAEAVVRAVFGADAEVRLHPAEPPCAAWQRGAYAEVRIRRGETERCMGSLGLLADAVLRENDLDVPLVACELELDPLLAAYPPAASAEPLPAFPGIERDLSLVVDERTRWADLAGLVERLGPARLERLDFVGTYRGKQVGAGRKSVTMRMRFRDPERTLRREEVDPEVAAVTEAAGRELGAEVRA